MKFIKKIYMSNKSFKLLLSACIITFIIAKTFGQENLSSKVAGFTKVYSKNFGCSNFNLENGQSTQETAELCGAKCTGDQACRSFSYNPVTKSCHLKVITYCMNTGQDELGYIFYTRTLAWSDDVDQELNINKNGYRKTADGDCTESDLGTFARTQNDTVVSCSQWCTRTQGCKGFSYSTQDHKCILKSINDCPVEKRTREYFQFYGQVPTTSP